MDIEIDSESLRELEELRRRHQDATRALIAGGDTAVTRMLAYITYETGKKWEASAPFLYGVLAGATREQVFNDEGRVYIDPGVTHPVLGGQPGVYGPVVHRRRPWVEQVFTSELPQIVTDGVTKFWGELSDIYT